MPRAIVILCANQINNSFDQQSGQKVYDNRAHAGVNAFEAFRKTREMGQDQLFKHPTNLTSIYVMDADGKNVKRLTHNKWEDGLGTWVQK